MRQSDGLRPRERMVRGRLSSRPSSRHGSDPPADESAATVETLTELALDLHWSWNHRSDEIWAVLDPELWSTTHNPWIVLQTVSRARLAQFLEEPANRERIQALLDHRRHHLRTPAWFQRVYRDSPLTTVAYFSMEFALSEALPIYSGGLGNVAGDQLKAACDLGVPVLGVGLLYQQGYFRQSIRSDGSQQALYPYNDPGQLPITPLRDAEGEWVHVVVGMPEEEIRLRAWHVRVDRQSLYLLDSNHPANPPAVRAITSELYGGDTELRLQQEIVLGIGGWRLLEALGIEPEVCHLNEGHAALAALERAKHFARKRGCAFDTALIATRAGNVFTTHTAVPAGFDRFPPALVGRYLGRYVEHELGISMRDLLALGRENPDDPAEPFNMAYLALRASGAVNGVSQLHGTVSRRLFGALFPRWPDHEVPIGHVTNGIHVPTWDSIAADALWTSACKHDRWRGTLDVVGQDVERVPDAEIWEMRSHNRRALVDYVRQRVPRELAASGADAGCVARARNWLAPDVLTLGFARRFATYKRPTLLLHSPDRLERVLTDPERPVQLVIAGKAHPADAAGQAMIAEWVRFSRRPAVEGRVVFVPDYDLLLAEHLVRGVDLWINTPRRPWEASGTSGMKVLVNGGLNLSELDGWWAEAHDSDVGWALGDGREHGDDPLWDAVEADSLYELLEREIVPAFYERDERSIPTAWVDRMRASMARLTPRFSTNRVIREYTERYYLPAAAAYQRRSATGAEIAERLLDWRRHVVEHWSAIRFGTLRVDTRDGEHHFAVDVHLGQLGAAAVRVELFAEPQSGGEPVHRVMMRDPAAVAAAGWDRYAASVPSSRPTGDFTPRVIPWHPDASTPLELPLELPLVAWLR